MIGHYKGLMFTLSTELTQAEAAEVRGDKGRDGEGQGDRPYSLQRGVWLYVRDNYQ